MRLFTLVIAIIAISISDILAQEYLVVTTVESVVPMGVGRSRMIVQTDSINVDAFTTSRVDGKKSNQKDVSRSDAKINSFDETKMLNFYSAVGINFQNIASNDAMISDKINKLAADGWEMAFVTSACESDAGKGDGTGIFITRYIFKRD
jgi:hypothetical protein